MRDPLLQVKESHNGGLVSTEGMAVGSPTHDRVQRAEPFTS